MARESHSLTLARTLSASPRSPQRSRFIYPLCHVYDTLNNHRARARSLAHGERELFHENGTTHAAAARRHLFLPADKSEKYFERKIIHAPAVYVFACVKMLILSFRAVGAIDSHSGRLPLGTAVWFASQMKCLSSQLAFSQSNNWVRRVSLCAVCARLCIMQLHQSGCALISERAVISFGERALSHHTRSLSVCTDVFGARWPSFNCVQGIRTWLCLITHARHRPLFKSAPEHAARRYSL